MNAIAAATIVGVVFCLGVRAGMGIASTVAGRYISRLKGILAEAARHVPAQSPAGLLIAEFVKDGNMPEAPKRS